VNCDSNKWKTESLVNRDSAFIHSKYTGELSNWDVSKVKTTEQMFAYSKFNGNISEWNTGNAEYMSMMFVDSPFTGDVSNWNVSKVKEMEFMFKYLVNFSCDLTRWKVNPRAKTQGMFENTKFPKASNFDDYLRIYGPGFKNTDKNTHKKGLKMKFKEYLEMMDSALTESERLLVLAYAMEEAEYMNESTEHFTVLAEGITDKILHHSNKIADKVGMKVHKSKGILDYLKSILTGVRKAFFYIFKGDVKKAKELLTDFERKDVLDFLYKLDLGTLHLFSTPIHTIDAWTGWDLGVQMKNKMQKAEDTLSDFISTIRTAKVKVHAMFSGFAEKTMVKNLDKIEQHAIQA